MSTLIHVTMKITITNTVVVLKADHMISANELLYNTVRSLLLSGTDSVVYTNSALRVNLRDSILVIGNTSIVTVNIYDTIDSRSIDTSLDKLNLFISIKLKRNIDHFTLSHAAVHYINGNDNKFVK